MISDDELQAAVDAGILDSNVRDRLVAFVRARSRTAVDAAPLAPRPKFDVTHVLWYAGALIVIGAMGLFSTAAFAAMGGFALTVTAIVYALGFVLLGRRLWRSLDLRVPGGLCIAVAVSLAPLAIYGVQDGLNLWSFGAPGSYKDFFPYVNGNWVYMEVGAIVASMIALRFFPFAFILLIAAVALWFMSMDIVRWFGGGALGDWELRRRVSLAFGLAMVAVAWALDLLRARQGDFGFWLHLFGAITLWSALAMSESSTGFGKALFCAISIAFIAFGLFLDRRIYAVLGTIGVAGYLGYLAADVFQDILLFSFVLSALGLAIIFLGIAFQRRQRQINAAIERHMPAALRALRPARAFAS
ncbi:hypothetical protein [Methylocapsa sp. S129]|uniref:hypothetical protein n=1 Tax=Methylocapsa sp. S129 TaxID=1641869 RepID=UPI00131BB746|nr:hypothetical protein [Methylocapsa sp. S129]